MKLSQEDGRPPSGSPGGGKSELYTGRVLDNVQAWRRDGKCHRDRPPGVLKAGGHPRTLAKGASEVSIDFQHPG
jgi:hypothetical protein